MYIQNLKNTENIYAFVSQTMEKFVILKSKMTISFHF